MKHKFFYLLNTYYDCSFYSLQYDEAMFCNFFSKLLFTFYFVGLERHDFELLTLLTKFARVELNFEDFHPSI